MKKMEKEEKKISSHLLIIISWELAAAVEFFSHFFPLFSASACFIIIMDAPRAYWKIYEGPAICEM